MSVKTIGRGVHEDLCSAERRSRSFEDDLYNLLRGGNQWCVVHGVRSNLRIHALGHEVLRFGINQTAFESQLHRPAESHRIAENKWPHLSRLSPM